MFGQPFCEQSFSMMKQPMDASLMPTVSSCSEASGGLHAPQPQCLTSGRWLMSKWPFGGSFQSCRKKSVTAAIILRKLAGWPWMHGDEARSLPSCIARPSCFMKASKRKSPMLVLLMPLAGSRTTLMMGTCAGGIGRQCRANCRNTNTSRLQWPLPNYSC